MSKKNNPKNPKLGIRPLTFGIMKERNQKKKKWAQIRVLLKS